MNILMGLVDKTGGCLSRGQGVPGGSLFGF